MSIALATRGYIVPRQRGDGGVCGIGPALVGTMELQPDVEGGLLIKDPAPNIVGGDIEEPNIVGAAETPVAPSTDTPDIAGGADLVPEIIGGK